MIRTQIYLTESEHKGIGALAKSLKKRQSEVIREAIDEYLIRSNPEDKLVKIRKAKGIWKGRENISFREMRTEFDRY